MIENQRCQPPTVGRRPADAGSLARLERDALDDAWGDELEHRLPTEVAVEWFRRRSVHSGLFDKSDELEPGMVFLVVVDAISSSGPSMTFPRLGEPGSIRAFRRTWNANPLSSEPNGDAYWRYVLSMYAANSRVFDFTTIAHDAIADQYEVALRTVNGRRSRG